MATKNLHKWDCSLLTIASAHVHTDKWWTLCGNDRIPCFLHFVNEGQCVEMCTSALRISVSSAYSQSFSLCSDAERCMHKHPRSRNQASLCLLDTIVDWTPPPSGPVAKQFLLVLPHWTLSEPTYLQNILHIPFLCRLKGKPLKLCQGLFDCRFWNMQRQDKQSFWFVAKGILPASRKHMYLVSHCWILCLHIVCIHSAWVTHALGLFIVD